MADIVTGTVTGNLDVGELIRDHSDIRREQSDQSGRVVDAVKTAGWNNSDRTGTEADRVVAQDTAYFIAGQQYAFQNATNVAALKSAVDMSFANTLSAINTQGALGQASTALEGAKTAAAVALSGEKQAAAAALAAANIGAQISSDGAATRQLINELKMDALNRELIERNAALVEHRHEGRYLQGQLSNVQYAQLNTALNAFQSQLQETRQGMVNFGTMAGVGQSSTSNNVR